MSIQTELTRLTNAKAAIQTAIEGKGVTVPSGTLLDGMAALIESIEAGGGIRIEQGSVTFTEQCSSYDFTLDEPDIFIAYVETDTKPVYSSSRFIWAIFQDTREWLSYGKPVRTHFIFGYNEGTGKYYTPYKADVNKIGNFSSSSFNSFFGACTYKWYAIYGVTAT